MNQFIFVLAEGLRELVHTPIIMGHHPNDDIGKLFSVATKELTISNEERKTRVRTVLDWFMTGSKVLERLKPDIVIVNGAVPLRPLRVFKVAVNHGNAIFELRDSYLKRFATRLLYGMYDRVLCVKQGV